MTPSLAMSGETALECVRALSAGLTAEQRMQLLATSLPVELRLQAWKELLYEVGCITPEEGAQMVHWTPQGFVRTATRENCAFVKLGYKQPNLYPVKEVDRMLKRLRVWPKGRPADEPVILERRAA